jgi:DNA-directed RNA polymerase subunit RPC12/RpoP
MSDVTLCAICGQVADCAAEYRGEPVCQSCNSRILAYVNRVEARIDRLQNRAERLNKEADADHDRAHNMATAIPWGQPIASNYRRQADINYRERIHKTYERAFQKYKAAAEVNRRAEAAEKNRAISSDDPAAILKLEEKLRLLEQTQTLMRDMNKYIRKNAKKPQQEQIQVLVDTFGISSKRAAELLTPDYLKRVGFADYELTNNNAEIRRLKARIADLKERAKIVSAATETVTEEAHGDITIERDLDENRLRLKFPGKPSKEVIARLKSEGFRWSPSNMAWQRQLNNSAEWAAKRILQFVQDKNS